MIKLNAKRCRECGVLKPLRLYGKHKRMADGHLNICLKCKRAYALKYRKENIELVHEYDRKRGRTNKHRERVKAYAQTEKGKAARKRGTNAYRHRNRDKVKAHNAVSKALLRGKLTKQPCEHCGSKKVEAHHDDYSKPLEINWLCVKCHKAIHVL